MRPFKVTFYRSEGQSCVVIGEKCNPGNDHRGVEKIVTGEEQKYIVTEEHSPANIRTKKK